MLGLCLALTYCSGGMSEGGGGKSPVGGPVSGAMDSGILSAPADPDLMEDGTCFHPYLSWGEGFAQSFKDKDWTAWHLESGASFGGKFMVGHPSITFKDIQIRVVHKNAAGTERRYRDFRFPEVPATGTVFEVNVDKTGFGDYVEFFISPRNKIPDGKGGFDCVPSDLQNFSETWVSAGDTDFEKTLGLMARFKIFTTLEDVQIINRPVGIDVENLISP